MAIPTSFSAITAQKTTHKLPKIVILTLSRTKLYKIPVYKGKLNVKYYLNYKNIYSPKVGVFEITKKNKK